MSAMGTVPRQCAVCGVTRRGFPCTLCQGTYHCSDHCLDADQAFHRPMCALYRTIEHRIPHHRRVLFFPMRSSQPTPSWMSFGDPDQASSLLFNDSRPCDIQMRAVLGGPWHERAFITQNRLAEAWLLDRELTVYGASGARGREMPVNRALAAALAEGGHVCDEESEVWRGPLIVVAAQRPVDSWLTLAERKPPRQPDAGSARAVIDDITPWDYRQVLNFAVRPTGLGNEAIVWIPRRPGSTMVDLEPEDAEFGEGDCDVEEANIAEGYEMDGFEDCGSEGSGVQVERPLPSTSWVSRAASPGEQ